MTFKKLFTSPEFKVILLFCLVLAVRLVIVFQEQNFNYDAYFSLRQMEHIKATGLPLYNDPLSYGGKSQLFAPLHYYVLAIFSFLAPIDIVAKIVPNIFAALIIIVIYHIALKLTKNTKVSLLTAFMSGFIPALFIDVNKVAIDYITLFLVFLTIYFIFRINEKKYVDYALIAIFLLVLTTPLAFVLMLGLLFYLLLSRLENLGTEMKELEIILFFTFLVSWVNLLIYKNAFLSHGLLVIWQNTPMQILSSFFDKLTFLEAFITISIIPLILGIYASYLVFSGEKNKEVMLLTGLGVGIFVLLWFKLISLVTGLVFLGITLVILTSFSLKFISDYLDKTKVSRHKSLFMIIFLVLFAVSAIVPSVLIGMENVRQTPTNDDINVLKWAGTSLPENATIAASLEEGNLVAYYAKRKNIMDTEFLLTPQIDQRLTDLETIFQTRFETEAISSLNKYDAKYIFFTPYAARKFSIDQIAYTSNNDCFQTIYYLNNTILYQTKCRIG